LNGATTCTQPGGHVRIGNTAITAQQSDTAKQRRYELDKC